MNQSTNFSGRTRVAAISAGLLLIAGACGSGKGDAASQPMHLSVVRGPASLVHEGKSRSVTGSVQVAVGDSIVMGKGSRAELTLDEGRSMELRGVRLSIDSTTAVKLSGGELLAIATKQLTVDTESVVVEANKSAVRIDRSLATMVANYGPGQVGVAGVADELTVPAFRQATIAGGIVPRAPRPIQIDPRDEWDQRYLQPAIDLDGRLANFARGLEAQLGAGSGIEFFQTVAPLGTELGFLSSFLTNRRSDVLIGLILASQANISGVDLPGRFTRIFELWTQGATWGLLAHEFSVAQEGVFARLLEAVQKAGLFSPSGAGPGLNRRPTRNGARRPTPGPSPTRSQTQSPSPQPPPPEPCTQEPKPPEYIVSDPGSIIDDLFNDQPQAPQGGAIELPVL